MGFAAGEKFAMDCFHRQLIQPILPSAFRLDVSGSYGRELILQVTSEELPTTQA